MTALELFQSIIHLVFSNLSFSLGLIFFAILLVYKSSNGEKRLPPGPKGVPILGYYPFLHGKLEDAFQELGKKYGDIFYMKLGVLPTVVLNSYDAIREAFVNNADAFSGRHQGFNVLTHLHNSRGVLVENGPYWKSQRRFILSNLRDFGVGRQYMEQQIQLEAESVVEELASKNGSPYDIRHLLTNASANIISSVAFGKRYKYDDPEFQRLLNLLVNNFQELKHNDAVVILPWLRFLPKFMTNLKGFDFMKKSIIEFLQERIKEHISAYDETNIRDYIDSFWKEHLKTAHTEGVEDATFNSARLVMNVMTLFLAGTTTTSNTLYWIMKMLVMYPEIQEKVHKEIESVIGRDRRPSLSDKANMQFTDAFIMESQRFADIVPVGIPRSTTVPTTLNGYYIPKDTFIFPNLHAVHYDKKLWGDPENFRPERFIGPDGKATCPEYLIPFQNGKRRCIGESLAKMQLFLYMTTILQNFVLHSEESESQSITLRPHRTRDLPPFQLCAISRK